jgi:TonB family protein
MSLERKDKVKAGIGTILFHALLLLTLFFMALKTPLPLPEEEGVEVNLGYSAVGQNVQQPQPEEIQAPPPQPVQEIIEEVIEEIVDDAPLEEIVEEDTEEAPAIADKPEPKKEPEKKVEKPIEQPKEEKKPEPEKKVEQPKEIVQPEPEPEPEPVVDQRLMYTGRKASSSEGNDEQQGDKGRETGVPDAANYTGLGGLGSNGISYNLGNRKASTLPKPTYNSDDQGRVNVSIWVDKSGRVIRAEILQKGTTVSDISLRNMAKQAALKAKFAADPEAVEIQKGTITYNFIKLN